jgi:hypothetical protein
MAPFWPAPGDQVVHNAAGTRVPIPLSEFHGWRNGGPDKANAGSARQAAPLPVFTPPLKVDTSADADALRQLWQNVRLTWESLGDERPFHSVLTEQQYLPDRIGETEAQFWESGRAEAEQLAHYLGSIGFASSKDLTVIEYGCGVGRVRFRWRPSPASRGYDISDRISNWRQRALALGRTNIRLIALGLPATWSRATLFIQRSCCSNPPPIIGYLLRMLIRSLRRGGVGVFRSRPTTPATGSICIQRFSRRNLGHGILLPAAGFVSLFADEGRRLRS